MRTEGKVTVPAREYIGVLETTCDTCKGEKAYSSGSETDYWHGTGHSNTRETTVSLKVGNFWPEGGTGKITTVDICPRCFTYQLLPLLKEKFGVEPKTKSADY